MQNELLVCPGGTLGIVDESIHPTGGYRSEEVKHNVVGEQVILCAFVVVAAVAAVSAGPTNIWDFIRPVRVCVDRHMIAACMINIVGVFGQALQENATKPGTYS